MLGTGNIEMNKSYFPALQELAFLWGRRDLKLTNNVVNVIAEIREEDYGSTETKLKFLNIQVI